MRVVEFFCFLFQLPFRGISPPDVFIKAMIHHHAVRNEKKTYAWRGYHYPYPPTTRLIVLGIVFSRITSVEIIALEYHSAIWCQFQELWHFLAYDSGHFWQPLMVAVIRLPWWILGLKQDGNVQPKGSKTPFGRWTNVSEQMCLKGCAVALAHMQHGLCKTHSSWF